MIGIIKQDEQMGLNQTYQLLHSIGNHEKKKKDKTNYGMEENICKR